MPSASVTRTLLAALAVAALTACGDGVTSVRAGTGGPAAESATPGPTASATATPDDVVTATVAPPTFASASASPSAAPKPAETSRPPARRDPDQKYAVTALVLENAKHGPELCVGGVATSMPPQCGGVPVTPFSWDDIAGEESQGGTTWGEARFVGTFDGRVFHLTEPPGRPERRDDEPGSLDDTFPTKCAEPAGGWVVDSRRTGSDDLDAATSYANSRPDVAAVWLSYPDGGPAGSDDYDSHAKTVLNLAFTGDLDEHRRAARAVWGGGLCVTELPRTRASLSRAQDELGAARAEAAAAGVHLYGSNVDEIRNRVEASVLIDDEVSRRWVEDRFGKGVVVLKGIFRPVG